MEVILLSFPLPKSDTKLHVPLHAKKWSRALGLHCNSGVMGVLPLGYSKYANYQTPFELYSFRKHVITGNYAHVSVNISLSGHT